jgi:hypothetical protein
VSEWTDVPEPVTWKLRETIAHNGVRYAEVTLRAPTGGDTLKAASVRGSSNLEIVHRLIEEVSGVHYDVVKQLPEWMIGQMAAYFEEFAEAPAPDPLERWRQARRDAAKAEADAAAKAEADAAAEALKSPAAGAS